jgi:hypothetical protein
MQVITQETTHKYLYMRMAASLVKEEGKRIRSNKK